jgi:uncharacterized membrane protein
MYTWYQWLAFFFIYGFFGWIWETSYVSVCQKRFVNRGFLHGPMIPIYAFGALAMLILALPVKANMLVTYVVGMVGATLLELVTGWLMERLYLFIFLSFLGLSGSGAGQLDASAC